MKNYNAPENQTTRRILLIACATALAVAFTVAPPQPAHADPVSNEVMLVNAKTGKCLTIAGGVSTDNNVEAVQFDCDSDPSRRWRLNEMTGGTSTRSRTCRPASA